MDKINLGLIHDIPDEFKYIIQKHDELNMNQSYDVGWFIDGETIEHPGNNPIFSSRVIMFPQEKIGISLLFNTNQINLDSLFQIKNIIDGDINQTYRYSPKAILDIVLTLLSVVFVIISKKNNDFLIDNVKIRFILFIVTIITALYFPILFGYTWSTMLVWFPYSVLSFWLSFIFLGFSKVKNKAK